ncbi:MAG TPA: arylesterase [Xanthomonadales bacterium]|nr:arylesterase [Xanthomonadales bacterium]
MSSGIALSCVLWVVATLSPGLVRAELASPAPGPISGPTPAQIAGPILVLGDSLSAAHNLPASRGWVALLEDRLRRHAQPAPKVINASISGETSAGGRSRLPALLSEHRPALVIIELGGNDGLRGLPPAQLRENLDAMIAASREAGAKVLLIGIDVPPNYGPAYRRRFTAVFHELAEHWQVPLLPFLLDGVALNPDLMQADGIHPTAEAQPILLDSVWSVLEPLL